MTRAAKLVAKHELEITSFLRLHILQEKNRQMFGSVLKSLYSRAELYGAAMHFDALPTKPHCCR